MKEIVLTIDEELCAAVEAEAQMQSKTREMIIIEALKEWLQILEEEREDILVSEAALEEYRRKGGTDAFAYFKGREDEPSPLTAERLVNSGLVGLWEERKDIEDSVTFARYLRERAQRRDR